MTTKKEQATSRLQAELKKRRPFDSPHQEAVLNVLRTNDQFQNKSLRLFRHYGLTPSQYNVLRILRGEGKPMPCLEVASRMIQVVPAITGLIDRLEAQELVMRERCSEDRRIIYITLTDKARKLLDQMDEPVMALHRALVGHMTQAELKELSRLLEKARERVDSVETPGESEPVQ
jgi:DNA-binding MarR family transcriptional regulator